MLIQNGAPTVWRVVDVQVTCLYMAVNGAAIVPGGYTHPPLHVTFELMGKIDATEPRVSNLEHIMQLMEVRTGRGDGEVLVERLALITREGSQFASRQPPRRRSRFAR